MDTYGELIDANTVRFQRLLPGPVERVWSYLVEPDKRARWFCGGKTDGIVGGTIDLVFRNSTLSDVPDERPPHEYADADREFAFDGEITRFEPPHVLAHTWNYEDSPSEVCYELSEQGDRVLLTLTHTRLKNQDEVLAVCGGWHAHLAILADELEGVARRAFWKTHTAVEAEYVERLGI